MIQKDYNVIQYHVGIIGLYRIIRNVHIGLYLIKNDSIGMFMISYRYYGGVMMVIFNSDLGMKMVGIVNMVEHND